MSGLVEINYILISSLFNLCSTCFVFYVYEKNSTSFRYVIKNRSILMNFSDK